MTDQPRSREHDGPLPQGASTLRRLWLFARDYWSEFGCAWSVARMRDCERSGGHRWSALLYDGMLGHHKTCRRCGCSQTFPSTTGTSASQSFINVEPESGPFGF